MDLDEYWSWVTVTLFVLISLDLLTTLYAVRVFGLQSESNFIMRVILKQPIYLIIAIHIGSIIICVSFFYALFETYKNTKNKKVKKAFSILIKIFLGLTLSFGLFILANNISLIILGEDLISNIFKSFI